MLELPDRDPDQRTRALEMFAATAGLALEQLQLAGPAIDADPPDPSPDASTKEELHMVVDDACVAVTFFASFAATISGRPAPSR